MNSNAVIDKEVAESQGYAASIVEVDRNRATWYRPDGLAIYNLPTDGFHMSRYLSRGWSTTPPAGVAPKGAERQEEPGVNSNVATTEITIPKHIHVMQPKIGSQCMVVGCEAVRKNAPVVKNAQK